MVKNITAPKQTKRRALRAVDDAHLIVLLGGAPELVEALNLPATKCMMIRMWKSRNRIPSNWRPSVAKIASLKHIEPPSGFLEPRLPVAVE
jgi:hypothetical protein